MSETVHIITTPPPRTERVLPMDPSVPARLARVIRDVKKLLRVHASKSLPFKEIIAAVKAADEKTLEEHRGLFANAIIAFENIEVTLSQQIVGKPITTELQSELNMLFRETVAKIRSALLPKRAPQAELSQVSS